MTNLQARLIKIIKEENFNLFEIAGFKANPKLSLLAGAAIGYKLAIADSLKLLNHNPKSS